MKKKEDEDDANKDELEVSKEWIEE